MQTYDLNFHVASHPRAFGAFTRLAVVAAIAPTVLARLDDRGGFGENAAPIYPYVEGYGLSNAAHLGWIKRVGTPESPGFVLTQAGIEAVLVHALAFDDLVQALVARGLPDGEIVPKRDDPAVTWWTKDPVSGKQIGFPCREDAEEWLKRNADTIRRAAQEAEADARVEAGRPE